MVHSSGPPNERERWEFSVFPDGRRAEHLEKVLYKTVLFTEAVESLSVLSREIPMVYGERLMVRISKARGKKEHRMGPQPGPFTNQQD